MLGIEVGADYAFAKAGSAAVDRGMRLCRSMVGKPPGGAHGNKNRALLGFER